MSDPNIEQAMQRALAAHRRGNLAEAESLYREVVAARPGHAEAWHRLGEIAYRRGEAAKAVELIGRAVRADPSRADLHCNLGEAYRACGRAGEAERCFREALLRNPGFAEAHNNLGATLKDIGRLDEAAACLRRAVEIKPAFAMAYNNLGSVLMAQARLEEAERLLRQALAIDPNLALALSNLGAVLQDFGAHAEAERCYRRALELAPEHAETHNNLGTLLQDRGRHDEAVASYRRALELKPGYAAAYSNLLLCLNCAPGVSPAELFAEHREYARRFAPAANPAAASRRGRGRAPARLRIGYVSADFRGHPVAHFLEPVIAHHDRGRFAVHCYSSHAAADAVTARLQSRADVWRDIHSLDDGAAAELIRSDGVDILVDLGGHTAGNRLLVFARRPARLQASWLGYLNTTGLEAIDCRITDARASPKGSFDRLHTERLLRLPDCQWCYQPPEACPEVGPAPCRERGFVTFGAFSNPGKITREVIGLWSKLLAEVSGARLVLAGRGLAAGDEDFLSRFDRHGVARERLDIRPFASFRDYLDLHGEVDVVLDTFPYTGGTTSCHALWMGAPVVTLAGSTPPSRGGASLLGVIGLGKLVARTPSAYLSIATALAARPAALGALRAGMRRRMSASPLMDAPGFTRALETALRSAWQKTR
jgi:predicted O-linked N-acetylglucosamine transferase (SPINDLY family)